MTTNTIYLSFSGSEEERFFSTNAFDRNSEKEENEQVFWPFDELTLEYINSWFTSPNKEYSPIKIGRFLYDRIFGPKIKAFIKEAFDNSQKEDEVYIKISLTNNPIFRMIPFEILHDGEKFLFSSNRIFIRYVNDKSQIHPHLTLLKRSLLILAEPNDLIPWGHDEFLTKFDTIVSELEYKPEIIPHAKIEEVNNLLLENTKSEQKFDSIFIIAHGSPATDQSDGVLYLEDENGNSANFYSGMFTTALTGFSGCFIFLCSCWSGNVNPNNPLASVGHQLIYNGQAGIVLAMQRPVSVDLGIELLRSMFSSMSKGENIYNSYRKSNTSSQSTSEHGIPCLYSRPIKNSVLEDPMADSFSHGEKMSISAVFSLEKKSRIALVLPSFIYGLKPNDYYKAKEYQTIKIPDGYSYRGITFAKYDVAASKNILLLLGKVIDSTDFDNKVKMESDDRIEEILIDESITHFVFFGSASLNDSNRLLSQYSHDFEYEFAPDYWILKDKRTGTVYPVKNPSAPESKKENMDYAIIEKIIDDKMNRVFYFIAGSWGQSTLAAAKYLVLNFNKICQMYGHSGFQLLLEVEAGKTEVNRLIFQRSPQKL